MSKWLMVDGFNLAYRCFFAIRELTRGDGFPTNAIHGWVKALWKLQDQEKPEGMLVFFDLGGAQDRLALHPEYKAQREEMPEALAQQLPYLKALTRAMGLGGIEISGVESDDLLAAQAVKLAREGGHAIIVSADKDFAQVVGPGVTMLLPPPPAMPRMGWRPLDAAGVEAKFGVPPAKIADYLALIGDTVDNIPGIMGVGPKTAVKWLLAYGDIEGVIAHASELKPDRFRELVASSADRLRLNLRLTTLDLSLPTVPFTRIEPDVPEICRILEEMEMTGSLTEARKRYEQRELF